MRPSRWSLRVVISISARFSCASCLSCPKDSGSSWFFGKFKIWRFPKLRICCNARNQQSGIFFHRPRNRSATRLRICSQNMECSRIPAASLWSELPRPQLEEICRHLKSCLACQRRAFAQAPDQLLFLLREEEMPADFWSGFWESLEKKLPDRQPKQPVLGIARVLRWAAVFVIGVFLISFSRTLPTQTQNSSRPSPAIEQSIASEAEFPIIEATQDSKAKYYIIQSPGNAKIVMMYDPDLQL